MKINKILRNNQVNGPGVRYVIWFQGCSIHCDGCLNTDTWEFGIGEDWTASQLFEDIKKQKIDGITLTGGEPLDQLKEVEEFLRLVFPIYNIFLTTGYDFDEVPDEIVRLVDILVSGQFDKNLLDTTPQWRGSTNQVIHFLTDRGKKFQDYKPKYKTEIRISKKDFETIKNGFSI